MDILKRDYDIDPEECSSEVKRNKFSDLTTSYYLISKRKERAGIFRQQYKDELKQMIGKKNKRQEQQKAQKQAAAAAQPENLEGHLPIMNQTIQQDAGGGNVARNN